MKVYGNTDHKGKLDMNGNDVASLVLKDDSSEILHGKPGRMASVLGRLLFCVGYEEPGNPESAPVWIQCVQEKNAHVHIQEEASSEWIIQHNMNTTRAIVQVYDMNGSVIIADSIEATSNELTTIRLTEAVIGYAVVLSGTATGLPVAPVRYEQSFTEVDTVIVSHNIGYEPIIRVVNVEGLEIMPSSILHTSVNSATVELGRASSGKIICT